MKTGLFFTIFTFAVFEQCFCAKILGIVVMPSKSHEILVERLLKELGKRGHEITLISPFPENKPVANISRVTVDEISQFYKGVDMLKRKNTSPFENVNFLNKIGLQFTELTLNNTNVQNLMKTKKFDLIVTEAFLSDSVYGGFSWVNQAPVVAFATLGPPYWASYMVGNIAPSSYIPDPLLAYGTKMNFKERLFNTIFSLMWEAYHRWIIIPKHDSLMRDHFGHHLPPLDEIIRNVSLVLVNNHFSLSYTRPYVLNMIEVGGIHIDPPQALPEDLQKFMDDAPDGVVLFSLGSNIKSSMMAPEKIRQILEAFSKLKQKVLWKFEAKNLPLPLNVRVSDWLPQSDLLAHPNLKVFITHGGHLSTTEAVYRGVPVIGIPIFGDQPLNMKEIVNAGFGIKLEYDELTPEVIVNAVNEIINNSKYRDRVQERSKIFRDQILPPLDKAVYWVEYVIRHKGALHLRSASQHLKWHELFLLDVAMLIVLFLLVICFIIKLFVKYIIKKLCLRIKMKYKSKMS